MTFRFSNVDVYSLFYQLEEAEEDGEEPLSEIHLYQYFGMMLSPLFLCTLVIGVFAGAHCFYENRRHENDSFFCLFLLLALRELWLFYGFSQG